MRSTIIKIDDRFFQRGIKMKDTNNFEEFVKVLYKPARRALESNNITSIEEMYTLGKNKLLEIHGIGPETIKRTEEFTGRKLPE